MSKNDLVYVGHMLETARKASAKVVGVSRPQFDGDENLQNGGRAFDSNHWRGVSQTYQDSHPDIPWKPIIGMRHRVVHDYLQVDYDIVWDVATANLPPLIVDLAKLAPPTSRSGSAGRTRS